MLTLSAKAWLKLQYLCHAADTEVGGFGLSNAGDLLSIEEIVTVQQQCSGVSVEFDDDAVADFFDQQVEQGRRPEQCGRVWIHTHPGDSATPSCLDEETFERVFGRCNWAVMLILACAGQTYCRLRVNAHLSGKGPGCDPSPMALSRVIPVRVDYESLLTDLKEIDPSAWDAELKANVRHTAEAMLPVTGAGEDRAVYEMEMREIDLDAFDLDDVIFDGLDPSDESNWDGLEVDDDESD